MSNFPSQLDTDAELPPIVDGASEISASSLNAIREAIFAIEAALGTDIEGSQQDLSTRLDAILNPDGTFKSAALIAAGLIALPITNSMVGSSAAIVESKLDLDFATQVLQNEINSNDIDIAAIQQAIEDILNKLAEHFAGVLFKHDGYAINLDNDSPLAPPAAISPLTAINVSDAIIQLKNAFYEHTSGSGAHLASNISVDPSNLTSINPTNVQEAIEQLDQLGDIKFIEHRDDMHANGLSKWANSADGYNVLLQKLPSTYGIGVTAHVLPTVRKVISFTGLTLSQFGIKQGDVVVISTSSDLVGSYVIDDVGPRLAIGSRSALSIDEVEIVDTFPSDGYVSARIFGPSSQATIKGNLAPTIYQMDTRVDSIQVSRPNAARMVSLGINPRFLTSSSSFTIEAGIASGTSRTIVVNGLNRDRNSIVVSPITVDSVVERINHILQNKNDGYAFPAAAYRVGDELMISHNWSEDLNCYLKIASSGASSNTLFLLGLDGYGANTLDTIVRPSQTSNFYVSGKQLTDVATILSATASVVGQSFTFPNGENPLALGVRVGHLLQLFNHTNSNECGTYYITNVSSTSITIHKVAGITTASNLTIKVMSDAVALDEVANYGKNLVLEAFIDSRGMMDYNIRLESEKNISNLSVVDVSDNFLADSFSLRAQAVAGGNQLDLGSDALPTLVPTALSAILELKGSSNIETLKVNIVSPIVVGTNVVTVFDHINEEEVLEVCSASFNGTLTLSHIVDKRLFGSTGLDEIREDVVLNYVETPLLDLRSNGLVFGFDTVEVNFQDVGSFGSSVYGILYRGGMAYVEGTKVIVPTSQVMIPNGAATYLVCLNNLGTFELVNEATTTLGEIIDGYFLNFTPISRIVHSGASVNPLSIQDLRFFINDLDSKLDLIVDITDKMVGNFNTIEAALNYIAAYPDNEKFLMRVVSFSDDGIQVTSRLRNFSLQVDGQVGNVEVDSSCRVFSLGLASRVADHIDGYFAVTSAAADVRLESLLFGSSLTVNQSTNSQFLARDCVFSGAVSLTGTSTSKFVFQNCTFSSTFTEAGGNIQFTNCTFSSTTQFTSGNTCIIDGCKFTSASFGTYASNYTEITNSMFSGADGYMFLKDTAHVSGCLFDTITKASNAIISIGLGVFEATLENCVFSNITLSGTGQILDGNRSSITKFINNTLDTITFISNAAIRASIVKNNTLVTATNNAIIECVGDGVFIGNNGIHVVQIGSNVADRALIISENVFPQNSIGYSVNATMPSGQTNPQSIICNNAFRSILTGGSGILLGSTSTNIQIIGNYFDQVTGNTGTAINMANAAGSIIVENNFFKVNTAFSFSNPVNGVMISNNLFVPATAVTCSIQMGTRFVFDGNTISATNITLLGSSPSRVIVSNNTTTSSSTLTINCSISDGHISSNKFDSLVFASGGLTDCVVTGNGIGTVSASGAFAMSSTLVTGNTFITSLSLNNVSWTNSDFTSNVIDATSSIIFDMATGNSLTVSDNKFANNAISITGISIIDTLSYRNNIGASALSSSIPLSSCFISGNDGYMNFTGGISLTNIRDNISSSTIALRGNVNNSIVSGNIVDQLSINPSVPSTNNVVSENIATTSIAIGDIIGSFEFTNSIVSNNATDGTFGFDASNIALSYDITNLLVTGNRIGDTMTCRLSSIDTCIFSNNAAVNSFTVRSDGDMDFSHFIDNTSISVTIFAGNDLSNCDASGNVGTDISVRASSDIEQCTICRNKIAGSGTLNIQAASTITETVIDANNAIESTGTIDISNVVVITRLIFSNNIADTILLPTYTAFSGTIGMSKFVWNYANTWDTTGTIITATSDSRLFPWGNTGNLSSGVSFGGTTSRTVANTNGLSGGYVL